MQIIIRGNGIFLLGKVKDLRKGLEELNQSDATILNLIRWRLH